MVRSTDDPLVLNGIQEGGKPIVTDTIGDTAFGEVYVSDCAIANVLAFSMVRDRSYMVAWDSESDQFTVQPTKDGPQFEFRRFNGLYVYDTRNVTSNMLVMTVQEKKMKYTKRENRSADLARDLMRKMALPSAASLAKLLNSGAILDCPVTAADVYRAEDIYGPHMSSLKGKTTTHPAPIVKFDYLPRTVQQDQTLHMDLLFIEHYPRPFLLSVADPLEYMQIDELQSKQEASIEKALTRQLGVLKAQDLVVRVIRTDPESGMMSLSPKLLSRGIVVNPSGSKEAVPKAERAIRTINPLLFTVCSRNGVCTIPPQVCCGAYQHDSKALSRVIH
jgi:hypothetical protein